MRMNADRAEAFEWVYTARFPERGALPSIQFALSAFIRDIPRSSA